MPAAVVHPPWFSFVAPQSCGLATAVLRSPNRKALRLSNRIASSVQCCGRPTAELRSSNRRAFSSLGVAGAQPQRVAAAQPQLCCRSFAEICGRPTAERRGLAGRLSFANVGGGIKVVCGSRLVFEVRINASLVLPARWQPPSPIAWRPHEPFSPR